MKSVEFAGRRIGPGEPCFVIAEAGVNHNGSLERALAMIDAAADAGCDAVKFQTFRTEKLVTPDAPKARYQQENTGGGGSQFEMLKQLELGEEAHRQLIARCRERGIVFLSTPFDEESADLLESFDVPGFKLPSGEITNLPLLAHVARKRRPILLSTGMATLAEVAAAVAAIRAESQAPLVLLQCVSNYPAAPSSTNLRAMETMASAFEALVGYSDHTLGCEVSWAAVALGAVVLEKHFTLDRSLPGPDHLASLDVAGLRELMRGVRNVEAALGDGIKKPAPEEADTAAVARKSLVAAAEIAAGTEVTSDAIVIRRPGTGIAPSAKSQLVGRIARERIAAGTVLQWEMFS